MKTVDIIQGTDAWKAHRAEHFNASDAPAMMGLSKYKTRSQLVKEYATGIMQEFDEATERRFADGHRFEALARPIAEEIICDDLSPVTGTDGKYSASFDGITFDESIIFEHKSLNNELRGVSSTDGLSSMYLIQMEHQMMVSGADQCLFMASKFDADDNLIEEIHFWYSWSPELRKQIIAGWEQFAIDVANYKHVEVAPEVIAAPVQDLPALSIQVSGAISLISNLQKFGARLNEFVGTINKEPSDDQGFADAESAIKTLKAAQDALEAAESNALAQTSDIDDMRKTVKLYADTARTARLMLEKMVKARKESIRIEIVSTAGIAFTAHVEQLERETKPIQLSIARPNFAGAIKNKRTLASLRESVDTVLRNGKIEADTIAADIRTKLAWFKEYSKGYEVLFADLQQIIYKPESDFDLLVETRINSHKAAEAAKVEAQRVAMQEEADRKAKAEQEALLSAERAKMEAEVQAAAEVERKRAADELKAQQDAQAALRTEEDAIAKSEQEATEKMFAEVAKAEAANTIEERRRIAQCAEQERPSAKVTPFKAMRPDDSEVIAAIQNAFGPGISFDMACDWIMVIAENLREAA